MTKTIITNSAEETRKLAENLAEKITASPVGSGAAVIALTGDLGSGKTAFTQGFAKALGVKEKITSPTFVIQKNYKLQTKNHKLLIHIDAYRIKDPKEIIGLGWEEMISNPPNIIIMEWAERIKKILPQKHIQINFEHLGGDKRRIKVKN
ncbi:MAG: tRNA (adenosine(37)-N6)-threonylcarbamoyltransferase complex ATPase subunit type 1 TsaE [bacterium]|nr:tRNA (adenosine(37)-N6)-threonylcarbamoyltransferase complex ATPase subunit type 1 TsaE [bacterium]